jgi:xanthine phosphoribosyltransferase
MELLRERIKKDGYVIGTKVLKVDSFLNHQIDVELFNEIGKEFKKRFEDKSVTKILTVEASGIGIACIAAQYFKVPVVFAKKHEATNLDKEVYEAEVYSFTKNRAYSIRVAKKFLEKGDKVLIIDDFLANGNAAKGLVDIVRQAGAEPVGVGIVIEKAFQEGRDKVEQAGVKVEALAIISSMSEGNIVFQ